MSKRKALLVMLLALFVLGGCVGESKTISYTTRMPPLLSDADDILVFEEHVLSQESSAPIPQDKPGLPEENTEIYPDTKAAINIDGIELDKPMLALTFDDGPSATTARILEILKRYDCKATFFVIGNRIAGYEDVLLQAVRQGSEVASHTWSHKKLPDITDEQVKEEILQTIEEIERATGITSTYMRPPYGLVDARIRELAKETGVAIIKWSVDTKDWSSRDAKRIYDHIMENAADGSIILCHDLHQETGDAMELVIPELIAQGYQLVTVSELMEAKGVEPEAGEVYRKVAK